jgi:hypothetical protein
MTGGVSSRCIPRSRGKGLSERCKTSGVRDPLFKCCSCVSWVAGLVSRSCNRKVPLRGHIPDNRNLADCSVLRDVDLLPPGNQQCRRVQGKAWQGPALEQGIQSDRRRGKTGSA